MPIVPPVIHLAVFEFGSIRRTAITFHPMLLTCDSSKRACLFPAFVLTDIVMTIIGCVTPCLISAAKVEIT